MNSLGSISTVSTPLDGILHHHRVPKHEVSTKMFSPSAHQSRVTASILLGIFRGSQVPGCASQSGTRK